MKTKGILFWILTVTVALALEVQAQSFLTNGLVAYYPFSGNANDASGHSINLTNNDASLTVDRFGAASRAMSFNGASSWLDSTNPMPIGGNSSRTISWWMNIPIIQTRQILDWGIATTGADVSALYLFAGDKFGTNNSLGGFVFHGNYCDAFFSPVVVTTNTWHHVVVVYSGDIRTTKCYLDANSIPINTVYNQAGNTLNTSSNTPLHIGVDATIGIDTNPDGGWQTPFWGTLDDIRIYNRALSSEEVAQLNIIESPDFPRPYLDLTLALSLSMQGTNTVNGTISTTASPKPSSLASKHVLNALAIDEYQLGNWPSNSFPRGTTLALAGDRVIVLLGTKILLNVSGIMSFTSGDTRINSGKHDTVTGLADHAAQSRQIAGISFDDTYINGGGNLKFHLNGILSKTITDTTPVNGLYTETQVLKLTSVAGDGSLQGVPFICTGTASARGTSPLHL